MNTAKAYMTILLLGISLLTTCGMALGGDGGETGTADQPVRIVDPADSDKVNGEVTIEVEVWACFCTGTTSLLVDGIYMGEGTKTGGESRDGQVYEIFEHLWDSSQADDGIHVITVYGKHNESFDTIKVYVEGDDGGTGDEGGESGGGEGAGEGEEDQPVRIIDPDDGDRLHGDVTITVEVWACFCMGTTSLLVDGTYIGEGTKTGGESRDGQVYEIFEHRWDSDTVDPGGHVITVYGKHNESFDAVKVRVGASDGDTGPDPDDPGDDGGEDHYVPLPHDDTVVTDDEEPGAGEEVPGGGGGEPAGDGEGGQEGDAPPSEGDTIGIDETIGDPKNAGGDGAEAVDEAERNDMVVMAFLGLVVVGLIIVCAIVLWKRQ